MLYIIALIFLDHYYHIATTSPPELLVTSKHWPHPAALQLTSCSNPKQCWAVWVVAHPALIALFPSLPCVPNLNFLQVHKRAFSVKHLEWQCTTQHWVTRCSAYNFLALCHDASVQGLFYLYRVATPEGQNSYWKLKLISVFNPWFSYWFPYHQLY